MTPTGSRSTFEQRLRATLAEDETRVPVILGLCGTGRTTVLRRLRDDVGATACQYVNVERAATTPERFLRALTTASPFRVEAVPTGPNTPRAAFDAILSFFSTARCPDGSPAMFLLDEVMEFRTFESFPGLRGALAEVFATVAATTNRFVAASRYVSRAHRALASASPHFAIVPIETLNARDVDGMLASQEKTGSAPSRPESASPIATMVQRLTGGRPAYARAVLETMQAQNGGPAADPIAALAAALEPEGRLSILCGHCYELRLHRARGYGALKAILEILSEHEPLTLTEISQRLGRTPGSTKDYLSWLDDVDLVAVSQKRYRFRDPLLRVWCRLHCRPMDPEGTEIAREVEAYAAACLPPVLAQG